jgi:isopropylmalate/homocitrate/citramalate synthase
MSNETPWKVPGKWSVSSFDFEPEVRSGWKIPPKVTIHDVTLRDGEQTPGVVFRKHEKLKIAHYLEDMGVHRIEGGMIATTQEDYEAIVQMGKEIKNAEICAFSRARRDDTEACLKAGVQRAIMEITAQDPIIKNIWGSRQKAAEEIIKLVQFAKQNGLKVTFFLMESSRASLDLLKEIIIPVAKEGKPDSIALVDTRGSCYPEAFGWLCRTVKKWVDVPLEVHCHNNFGFATASTLAGVTAGAEVVHACINGMGGNAALDECVMGLEAILGVPTGIKTERFQALTDMTMEMSKCAFYKPFTGPLTCEVEVGIATKPMYDRRTEHGYGRAEPFNYEVVGGRAIELVLGKKSGRYSIMLKAYEMGLKEPNEEQATAILEQVKKISEDNKRCVSTEEFKQLYAQYTR